MKISEQSVKEGLRPIVKSDPSEGQRGWGWGERGLCSCLAKGSRENFLCLNKKTSDIIDDNKH